MNGLRGARAGLAERSRPASAAPGAARRDPQQPAEPLVARLDRLCRDEPEAFRRLFHAASRAAANAPQPPSPPRAAAVPAPPPGGDDLRLDGPAGHAALLRAVASAFPEFTRDDRISELQFLAVQLQAAWDSPVRPSHLALLVSEIRESDAAAEALASGRPPPAGGHAPGPHSSRPEHLTDALRTLSAWIAAQPGGEPGPVEEAFASCDGAGAGRLTGPELLRFLSKEVPDLSQGQLRLVLSHLQVQGVGRDGGGFPLEDLRRAAAWAQPRPVTTPEKGERRNPRRPRAESARPPHLLLLEREREAEERDAGRLRAGAAVTPANGATQADERAAPEAEAAQAAGAAAPDGAAGAPGERTPGEARPQEAAADESTPARAAPSDQAAPPPDPYTDAQR